MLLTSDSKTALIHKSSVNNIVKNPTFPCPYFIFDEKVGHFFVQVSVNIINSLHTHTPSQLKTRAISAKGTTMVQPIHLLLFGSSSLIYHGNGLVKLDEWCVPVHNFLMI